MLHKAIKGFEDYLITDTGKMYSIRSQKYLTPQYTNGYVYYQFRVNGKFYRKRAHRLVAEAFIPNPGNNQTVDHLNHIRDDNRVKNLRWLSMKEQCDKSRNEKIRKEKWKAVVEVINDEVSIGYPSLDQIPKIPKTTLYTYHSQNNETFIWKNRKFIYK